MTAKKTQQQREQRTRTKSTAPKHYTGGKGAALDPTLRREFARLYVQGMPAVSAWRAVYPNRKDSQHTARKEACLFLRHPATQVMVEELRAQAHENISTNMNEWLASNLRPIRFDPARMYDEDGNLLHVRDMDQDTRACLQEVTHEEWKTISKSDDGQETVTVKTRTVKVKYRSPDGAEERLGKYHGAFKQDNEQQAPRLFDSLPRELQQALYERLAGNSSAS